MLYLNKEKIRDCYSIFMYLDRRKFFNFLFFFIYNRMEEKYLKKINQLKALKQYKNKTDNELIAIIKKREAKKALKKAQKANKNIQSVEWVGLTLNEEPTANELFQQYKDSNHIESFNDLRNLKNLVVLEIIQERYQKQVGELAKDEKFPSRTVMDSFNNNLNQIMTLKKELGLNVAKGESWMDFWAKLKKKTQKYIEFNSGAFSFKCPNCGEFALLVRKIDNYETFPFKCFRGTVLYNKAMMEDIEKGIITKKRVAQYFGCSEDYIDRIYNKVYLPEKKVT